MATGKSAGSLETLELLTSGPWILANRLDLWKPWNCEHRVHGYWQIHWIYGNPGTANTGSMDTGKSVGSEENPGTVNTGSMDTGISTGSVETLELLTQGMWRLANPPDLRKPWNC